jgi:hypothetical protein
MKAALVNTQTGIVENIIIVDSLEDPVPAGYVLAEISLIEIDYTDEEKQLYELLQEIDPEFVLPPKKTEEPIVQIGITKWNKNDGFY